MRIPRMVSLPLHASGIIVIHEIKLKNVFPLIIFRINPIKKEGEYWI
jgi:hypothetical protein